MISSGQNIHCASKKMSAIFSDAVEFLNINMTASDSHLMQKIDQLQKAEDELRNEIKVLR